jgi:hypothetical protein
MQEIQSKIVVDFATIDRIGILLTKILQENWVRSKAIEDAALEAKRLVNKLKGASHDK